MIRLCRDYQNRRVGTSTAYVVVTNTVAFTSTRLSAVRVHCRFDGRDACVEVNTTVASAYDPPVQSHGHRRLAPRSAFDDHLVGVGSLKDSAVIYF